jgi:hypothetical protein
MRIVEVLGARPAQVAVVMLCRGMFSQDTGAAVLAAAQEKSGDLIITDLQHDRLVLDGVTKAALASHVGDIVFV